MFLAKKSYFRRIFDLRHFYGPDDNLYHPTDERPGNRLKNGQIRDGTKKPAKFRNVAG